MGIIILLISISVAIAVGFVFVFYWNMKSGQYDDTYTPSVRMLFDDSKPDTNRFTSPIKKQSSTHPNKADYQQHDKSQEMC